MYLYGDKDKLEKWRYSIETIEVIIPDEDVITIPPERFVNIQLYDYYETHMFPIFYIQLALEDYYYYLILKNKDKVDFHLRIDKYPVDSSGNDTSTDNSNYENGKNGLKKGWVNDYFSIILDDDQDDMGRSEKEKEFMTNYENQTTDTDPAADDHALNKEDNVVEFYLFDKDLVDATKENINEVFSNVTVTDVITELFKRAGIKNVLMTPADNKTVYKELFIPTMSIMSAFKFLDYYYGIYTSGSYIYFGFKRAYVLPFSGKCNAWTKNEIKYTGIFIPYNITSEHSSACGSLNKKDSKVKSRYIVADCRSFIAKNLAVSNDYLNSNDIQLVDAYSGEKSTSKSNAQKNTNTKSSKKSTKKKNTKKKTYSMGKRTQSLLTKAEQKERKNFVKHLENPTENPFYGTTYVARSDAMSCVISLTLMDYDISGICLNKQFNIYFEDDEYYEKYKGSYAVLSATHGFTKLGEEDFQITTTLVLARTTENYGDMYSVFGKIKVSKNKTLKQSIQPKSTATISISDALNSKDIVLNITNNNIINGTTYIEWFNKLNTTMTTSYNQYQSGQLNAYGYLNIYADNFISIKNVFAYTNGVITEEESEVFYTTNYERAIPIIPIYWSSFTIEANNIVTQYNNHQITKSQVTEFYEANKSILDMIQKNYTSIISEDEFNTVVKPVVNIVEGYEEDDDD